MPNMLGDYIAVDSYINNGYKPIFCKDNLVKIVALNPKRLSSNDSIIICKVIKEDIVNFNKRFDLLYDYSYFITDYPIDVYRIISKNDTGIFFIRVDKDSIIPNISKDGWIISECDK